VGVRVDAVPERYVEELLLIRRLGPFVDGFTIRFGEPLPKKVSVPESLKATSARAGPSDATAFELSFGDHAQISRSPFAPVRETDSARCRIGNPAVHN
jgi:hypothetical protein